MRKEEIREIDGVEYTCYQFDIRKSLRILTLLSKRIGGPLSDVMESLDPKKKLQDQDLKTLGLGAVLEKVFGSIESDELYLLAKDICTDVKAKQTETLTGGLLRNENFDMHFSGSQSIIRLFKVCKFSLEVNYGDFLSAVAGGAGLQAAGEMAVKSPNSSTRVR